MTSIMEATPSQFEAARNHKARLARIAGRAFRPAPVVVPKVIALEPVEEPEATPADAVHVPWTEDRIVTVDKIKAAIVREFDVTKLDLESARRTSRVVLPRQIAMYLARTMTLRSLPDIGRRFGKRDHTTAVHAVKKINRLIAADPTFAARVEAIKKSIAA